MKYLKYIGIALLVVLLVFFGRGLMTPSLEYQCEISVEKPAKEVWGVLSDESKSPEWIEGFKRIESVSGTPGTVGAVSHIFVEDQGQEMMMTETITKRVEEEVYAMQFSMDFMDMDYEVSIDEDDGVTKITTKSITRGNGIFAKSLLSFMKGSMKKQEMKNLDKLRSVIANNTTVY